MSTQRYISNQLTHFVGRAQQTPDLQYEVLEAILTSGTLRAAPSDGTSDSGGGWMAVSGSPLCGDRYRTGVVCFCDIPTSDLGLHIRKYSPFGIAWEKAFMVEKGASPVFYVATNSPAVTKPPRQREAYFNEMIEFWEHTARVKFLNPIQQSLSTITVAPPGAPPRQLSPEEIPRLLQAANDVHLFYGLAEFIERHIFCYMKCFDASLPDGHPNNFYMEREWRIIGNVSFQLSDIARIFLPSEYSARFRDKFPTYAGELHYSPA